MNNRGFTLVEVLACLVLIGLVFGIGFSLTRGTRSLATDTINKISENEIYNSAKLYVLENNVSWNNDGDNIYSCVKINDMVSNGYFKADEVSNYKNKFVKVIKNNNTKVITDLVIMEECN